MDFRGKYLTCQPLNRVGRWSNSGGSMSRHLQCTKPCLLYTRKQTFAVQLGMSALGQKRTSVTSFGGRDVLIHAEQVCRIIALLDFSQAVVALPICRANPIRTFVHHEIYVSTSR